MNQRIKITDLQDPKLDIYARLSEVQLLRYAEPAPGIFIGESPKVIRRALTAGYKPISFLVADSDLDREAMEILEQVKVSGVFLTGGDTALGMLMNIEADGSQILSEIRVGIPLVRVKGGKYEGMKLVTKAGAFGADDAAAFALRKIKEA